MILLHWIFAAITGKNKRTLLSIAFNRWQSNERKRMILLQKSNRQSHSYSHIKTSSGDIRISNDHNYGSGNINGFDFSVEWGEFGFLGGILSEEDSLKLASHILTRLNYDYWKPDRKISRTK